MVGYLFDWTDWGNGQLMFCPVMGVNRFDSLSWQRNLGCWWRRRVERETIAGNLMTFLVVKVGVMIDEIGLFLLFLSSSSKSCCFFCLSIFPQNDKMKEEIIAKRKIEVKIYT